MRILICGINFSPEPVGIGKYTGEMAEWLARKGHEVRVITSPPHNPWWHVPSGFSAWKYTKERVQRCSKAPVEVFRCPLFVPKRPDGLVRVLYLATFGLSSLPVTLWQWSWCPSIVLVVEPTLFCSLQALCVAWLARGTSWLHIQDFEVDAAFQLGDLSGSHLRKWAFAVERKLLRRFDVMSAISSRMVERLISKGADASRCVLFPNWVDNKAIYPLSRPSPFRRELGLDQNKVVALYSGTMGKKQGLDLLVHSARQHIDVGNLLYVFSGEGSYRHELIAKTQNLPNVLHLPMQPRERLNDLLNLADIHLLPQRADAADLVMPSKLTGMLASGRPIVATAAEGTQLHSAVQRCGIVTPPGDVNALTSAIFDLFASKDLRIALGHRAREYAVSHLDLDEVLTRFEQVALSVAGRANTAPRELISEETPDNGSKRPAVETGHRHGQATF
ncbi:MAG TPA: glycosyltransferase WbuB [Candidatus Acidoferrum sp.]|nr:glycosyltransferase WbuB [Candidatus Acidoferrum sp.]